MKNNLRAIKENEGDPVIRGKALKVLGLQEDATPEEITMAFMRRPEDDPVNDHHRLTNEIRQMFRGWDEDRKEKATISKEKGRKAA